MKDRPPLPGEKAYNAVAKLRLIHRYGGSLVVPEVVFALSGNRFLTANDFSPSVLGFFDDGGVLRIHFRVADQADFWFQTTTSQHLGELTDGSHLYNGKLGGPKPILPWLRGRSRWVEERRSFDLLLFHHTNAAAKSAILESGYFRGSAWNYQGTRTLKDVQYVYLTNKSRIKTDIDLQAIGMSSQGELYMRCDDTVAGAGEIVKFEVYRESTSNRTSTLAVWVPVELLAPHHIIFHDPEGESAFYEIASPEIFRVPLKPKATAKLENGNALLPDDAAVRLADYSVIADATDPLKIGACLDEETTDEVFKFERTGGEDIISFWNSHQNRDLYSGKKISRFNFE